MALEGFKLNRRKFLVLTSGAAIAGATSMWTEISLAGNKTDKPLHGLSAFGDLKYSKDYSHFDYINPKAPKGGTFNFSVSNWNFNQNSQTFNTLNSFVLRGEAPPRMELCFDALMTMTQDEPDSVYGLVAETVTISEDRNTYQFKLRKEARFHDGSPLTAEDVAFSYEILREKGHPDLSLDLRDLIKAEVLDPSTVELRFNGKQSDRTILTLVLYPIFSKAYYSAREFDKSTLDAPLSSGPYRVGKINAGISIEYERVEDYWARDLPFAIGHNNFDRLKIEFFRERQAAFEAFKKGKINWREEFTSKVWATEYNFPALNEGKVIKRHFTDELRPTLQGWAINSRRDKFADIKTRQAIGLCFDFEWTNEQLFYGTYARSQSLFETSDFRANGLPSPGELALLNPMRSILPREVFGEAVQQPFTDGSGKMRPSLRKATKLLKKAGWQRKGRQLVDKDGRAFTLEFLIRSPTFERILSGFVTNLKAIGIDASIRLVDPAQFQARLEEFDFDVTGIAFSLQATPTGESMKQFFFSEYADQNGSKNYPGIKLESVDKLIDAVGMAQSREDLVFAMRALDRVLRSYHYWIPNWYSANHRIAYWDMFGFKEPKPDYGFPVEQIWWFDEKKAKAIGKA